VDLIRPGFLTGRRAERRPLEAIGQRLVSLLNPLMAGPLARYAAIPSETVADAIVALIDREESGRHVHENDALRRLGGAGR
jgi:hypothetical protein